MEKIEFTMYPTAGDFSKVALSRLWSYRGFRIYFVVMCIILLGAIIWYNYGPNYGKHGAETLGFCTFLGLIAPFGFFLGVARRNFKSNSPRIKDFTYRVDEQGFGWKSSYLEVSVSWEEARAIYETREFLFVRLKRGGFFTIFKNRVPDDLVSSVREVIVNAPVQNKKMLSDEKLK